MKDTLPKLPNELPNTDEPERIAATLIIDHYRTKPVPTLPSTASVALTIVGTTLKPVWMVDFYRGRPGGLR